MRGNDIVLNVHLKMHTTILQPLSAPILTRQDEHYIGSRLVFHSARLGAQALTSPNRCSSAVFLLACYCPVPFSGTGPLHEKANRIWLVVHSWKPEEAVHPVKSLGILLNLTQAFGVMEFEWKKECNMIDFSLFIHCSCMGSMPVSRCTIMRETEY